MNLFKLVLAVRKAALSGARAALRVGIESLPLVLAKVAELEMQYKGPGNGSFKLNALLTWAQQHFKEVFISEITDFVSDTVNLYNVLGWFKK